MAEHDIGDYCLVNYSGKYNRAIVQETFADADKFCAKVTFCDFGDSTQCEIDDILIIPEKFISFLPPQVSFKYYVLFNHSNTEHFLLHLRQIDSILRFLYNFMTFCV